MQQRKLNNYHQKNIAVVLENCEVKPARQGEGYKVMLKTSTLIQQYPKKLDVTLLTSVARPFAQQETSDKGEEERKKGQVTLNRMPFHNGQLLKPILWIM